MTLRVIGGRIRPKEHKKLLIEDHVDNVLDRLIFAKEEKNPAIIRKDCLFRPEDMGPLWIAGFGDQNREFFDWRSVDHPKLVWPMSFGIVFPSSDNTGGNCLDCTYFETISAARLRGKCSRIGRYNVAMAKALLTGSGEWISALFYATWCHRKWIDAGLAQRASDIYGPIERSFKSGAGELSVGELCGFGQSMALTYRYEWGAQFSIAGSPRVIIPTTPAGVLELFNDRDKPADQDRRKALKHWVRQHLRKRKRDSFARVRRHMRGETSFSWRGFDVTIIPSDFDSDLAEAAE